ncbi:MAG: NAD-dependent epimerase/dehydratase family protein [Clostridia bacterium]|nr:NAD-dependent epimerase/dehydratase family protein [Clostridia bacterium]
MVEKLSVVTGANGYIGYALVSALSKRGGRARLVTRKNRPELAPFGFEQCVGDLSDEDFLDRVFAGAETVYHVAGMVDITQTKDDLVWAVNYGCTEKVVRACSRQGVKNLVYVSSVDCIPAPEGDGIIRETNDFDPDLVPDAYGKSKAAASRLVLDSDSEELKCIVVQPSCCIGPYDIYGTNSVCTMIKLYMKGLFPVSLDFGGYNFVDVRDVAEGMIAAAESGRGGEAYFLSGERISVDEFISDLARISSKEPPKLKLGKKLLLTLCPAIEVFFRAAKIPPVLTPFSINKICENCSFSYEKAAKDFGYSPRSAYDSLKDTVEWLSFCSD